MPARYAKTRSDAKYPGLWDELWTAINFRVAGGSNASVPDLAPRNARSNHTGGPATLTWNGATATQQVRGTGGVGAYFRGTGASNKDYIALSGSTSAVNNATIIIDLRTEANTPVSDENTCLTYGLGISSSSECYPWMDNNLYMCMLHTTRQTITANSGFDKSKRHILAVSVRCGSVAGGWRIFQGGKLLSSATSPAANALAFNASPRIGSHSATYYFNGTIYRFYLYGRTLTDQEICRFCPYDHDYDPFTAKNKSLSLLMNEQAAGGGGGFQSAWATNATAKLIGAGVR